jgi:hypothetical protein
MKQDFVVVISTETDHTYRIEECNTLEEAESIAEQMLSEGEEGSIEVVDSYVVDSFPVEGEVED